MQQPSWLLRWFPLAFALVLAIILRLVLWGNLPREGMISDEAEYLAAATWLAQGRGFAWHQGWLWTRAPLYPMFLALHIRLFGLTLIPIYLSQLALSLLNVVLVYVLSIQASRYIPFRYPTSSLRHPASIAAILAALCFPIATYPQMLLSETLFLTLLLGMFVVAGWWASIWENTPASHSPSPPAPAPIQGEGEPNTSFSAETENRKGAENWTTTGMGEGKTPLPPLVLLILAGMLMGLATLTRGLTLGFVPLMVGWVAWVAWRQRGKLPRIVAPIAFVVAFLAVLLPWSLYASSLYGGMIIVDTTSAYNLLLGVRTATNDPRSSTTTRQFAEALVNEQLSPRERNEMLAPSCLMQQQDPRLLALQAQPIASITQVERQRIMTAEAWCVLRQHPMGFVHKSFQEIVRFFQINYTGAERMSSGFAVGRLPHWYAVMLFLLDDTLYVLMLPLAIIGWASHRSPLRPLVGWWFAYLLLTAPLLFAINRFRLPLLPLLAVYAPLALSRWLQPKLPAPPAPAPIQGEGGIHPLVDTRGSFGGGRIHPLVDTRGSFGGGRPTPESSPAPAPITGEGEPPPSCRFPSPACGGRARDGGDTQKGWGLRTSKGAAGVLALLLAMVSLTPYAYLQLPPTPLSSYMGPYPSSVVCTHIAWITRPIGERSQRVIDALGAGAGNQAQILLSQYAMLKTSVPSVTVRVAQLAPPLIAGVQGQPAQGLALLPDMQTIDAHNDWQSAIVRGDLLRRMGDEAGAKAAFTPVYVDDHNPVDWAWEWLHPTPTRQIDLAGNLDLGYIKGFYLGEGDPSADGTFRWSAPQAWLRFPQQGQANPQQLCLRADGRGIPTDREQWQVRVVQMLPTTPRLLGTLTIERTVQEYCVPVEPMSPGADLVIKLESDSFVPPAADLLAQQGPQTGQLRIMGVRLDWAELRAGGHAK